jgi:RNA polymerase sigma factor (sigma-70 family)
MTEWPEPDADYAAFVSARTPALLRFGYLLTGNATAAEDLLREVLLSLWPRWAQVSQDGAEEHWVRAGMARRQVSRWRRRSTAAAADPDGAEPAYRWHVTDTDSEHIQDAVWAALAGVPPLARVVLVLRFHEGLSERETAEVLGRSVGTVTTQAGLGLDPLPEDPAELDRTMTLTRALTRHVSDLDDEPVLTEPGELVAAARRRRVRNRRVLGVGALVLALAVALTLVLSDGGTPAGPPSSASTSRPIATASPRDLLVQAELLRVQAEVTRTIEAAFVDAMNTQLGALVVTPVFAAVDGAPLGWSAALSLPVTPAQWQLRVEVYATDGRYRDGMGDLRCDGRNPTRATCGRSTTVDGDVVFGKTATVRIRNADGTRVGYQRTADRIVFRTGRRISAALQQADFLPGDTTDGSGFAVYSGPVNPSLLTQLARSSALAALPLPPAGSQAFT